MQALRVLRNAVARGVRDLLYPQRDLAGELRDSETRQQSVEDWWEHQHRRGAKFWLSGSRSNRVWKLLGIRDRITPGRKVLNIGVGLGVCTKALVKKGCQVEVLDISIAALERVASITHRQWLPDQLAQLPANHFDLAISFLVAQHMSHEGLRDQLMHVIRSLTPEGVFALQISFPLEEATTTGVDSPADQKSGSVVRTASFMEGMIRAVGGRIESCEEIGCFPEYGSGWRAYHLRKRTD